MSFLVNLIKNKVARFSTDASGNTALEGADGSIAFNAAELRGASPSATAAVNTAGFAFVAEVMLTASSTTYAPFDLIRIYKSPNSSAYP